jgi:hypothetical protein
MRGIIPDFITIGVGYNGIAGGGSGGSIELNWVTRGEEASWLPVLTLTTSVGVGYSVGATLNIGGSTYLGNANDVTSEMLRTNSLKGSVPTCWVSGSASAGGKIGGTSTYTWQSGGHAVIGGYLNIGVGAPAGPVPINAAGGISNTLILHKF